MKYVGAMQTDGQIQVKWVAQKLVLQGLDLVRAMTHMACFLKNPLGMDSAQGRFFDSKLRGGLGCGVARTPTQKKFKGLREDWTAAPEAAGGFVLAADTDLQLGSTVQEGALVPAGHLCSEASDPTGDNTQHAWQNQVDGPLM